MEAELAEVDRVGAFAALAWAWMVAFLPRLGAALLILGIGLFLARWASSFVRAALIRTRRVDATAIPVFGTTVRYAVIILVLIAALGQLGIQTTSLLAVLGAAGLAIGLALQGTLSNIAAGIMLLYLRPFRVGDYVETTTVSGTVKEIGLFATHLENTEGVFVFAPNSELWNRPIRNQTRTRRRMMALQISAGYDADPAEVRRILIGIAASDARILTEPAPVVQVDSFLENRVIYTLRAWATPTDFGAAQRDIMEEMKQRLQAAGIKLPM
jgi:small conductance mechanosensitive channel